MMHFAKDRNDIAGECASSHQHHEAMEVMLNQWHGQQEWEKGLGEKGKGLIVKAVERGVK
jgi:hypothetical protein